MPNKMVIISEMLKLIPIVFLKYLMLKKKIHVYFYFIRKRYMCIILLGIKMLIFFYII